MRIEDNMRNIDKYSWVPLIAMFVGVGLPALIINFEEDSWQWKVQMGIFTSMAALIYVLFNKFGKIYPKLRTWVNKTLLGATVAIFLGSLLASIIAVLFAMLPLPSWLHFGFAVVLALVAFGLLIQTEIYSNRT